MSSRFSPTYRHAVTVDPRSPVTRWRIVCDARQGRDGRTQHNVLPSAAVDRTLPKGTTLAAARAAGRALYDEMAAAITAARLRGAEPSVRLYAKVPGKPEVYFDSSAIFWTGRVPKGPTFWLNASIARSRA